MAKEYRIGRKSYMEGEKKENREKQESQVLVPQRTRKPVILLEPPPSTGHSIQHPILEFVKH